MEISGFFGEGGKLEKNLDDYEYRPEQLQMAEAVAESIDSGNNLVVEAGTGTGKTLAYLTPAILSGKQVVISTGTKNLQEQVYFRDIPFLKKHLKADFRAVMLKGRSNYLCPHRLERFAQQPLFRNNAEEKHLKDIFAWSKLTKVGDRSELKHLPEDSPLWNQVCSNPDFCNSFKCPSKTDCFLSKLRKKADESEIIVVNHYLFFADLAIRSRGGNGVLPDYESAIFDEAHQVEEIASQYFGYSVSNFRIEDLLRDSVREIDKAGAKVKEEFIKEFDNLDTRVKNLFHSFSINGERRFSLASNPPDSEAADILVSSMTALEEKLSALNPLPDEIRSLAHRYRSLSDELAGIIEANDEDFIFWGEVRGRGVYLNASAIEVSETLNNLLYSRCHSIFTSATLASAGDFSYFKDRLGLEDALSLALPSPFNYEKQATIYLPKLPDPNSPKFLDALAEEALKVITLVKGKTLFLFTSFKNMYEIRKRLGDKIGYEVHMQGDGPKHILLEQFRDDVDSVLFATSSFWQGVDVRGEALSCVIIDRLPFVSPGDPIMSARIERVRKKGGNPFTDYQLPYAVLTLKQGLGRLIRHRNDKGIMMIADNRLQTKGYGKTFLASLPPAPVVKSFDDIRWT